MATMVAFQAQEVASYREFVGDGAFRSSLERSACLLPRVATGEFRGPARDEVEVEVLKAGNGTFPQSGDEVTVHHVGRLAGVGSVFDASRSKGKAFSFKLGAKAVVPAFEMGCLQTSLGGTTRIRAPARYAYGDHGVPKLIEPGTDLVFDVTLVKIGDRVVDDDPPVVEQLEELPPWLAAIAPPETPPEYASFAAWRKRRRTADDDGASPLVDHPNLVVAGVAQSEIEETQQEPAGRAADRRGV